MAGQIILRNVIVKHNIPVTGYHGNTVHVIIFYDPKTSHTWVWKTQTSYALNFKAHNSYSIQATDEGDFNISHVRDLEDLDKRSPEDSVTFKSEQPDRTPDAWDKIFRERSC